MATLLRSEQERQFKRFGSLIRVGGRPRASHAETAGMVRAAEKNGGTLAGKTVTVTINRPMCRHRETVLPKVRLELGNPTVTFIEPSGRVRIMRDGDWFD